MELVLSRDELGRPRETIIVTTEEAAQGAWDHWSADVWKSSKEAPWT